MLLLFFFQKMPFIRRPESIKLEKPNKDKDTLTKAKHKEIAF